MSREIKFRVWQPEERRMLLNCGVQRPTGGYLWGFGVPAGAGVDDIEHYSHHDSVMQFTGLHDKNDVEIYEGDIVRAGVLGDGRQHGGKDEVQYTGLGIIDIDPVHLCVNFRDGGRDACYTYDSILHRATEVVGNIHENPDLLG